MIENLPKNLIGLLKQVKAQQLNIKKQKRVYLVVYLNQFVQC